MCSRGIYLIFSHFRQFNLNGSILKRFLGIIHDFSAPNTNIPHSILPLVGTLPFWLFFAMKREPPQIATKFFQANETNFFPRALEELCRTVEYVKVSNDKMQGGNAGKMQWIKNKHFQIKFNSKNVWLLSLKLLTPLLKYFQIQLLQICTWRLAPQEIICCFWKAKKIIILWGSGRSRKNQEINRIIQIIIPK